MVVLAVVVGAAAGHGPYATGVDPEGEVAGVVQVDVAVVAAAVAALVGAEAEDLAAAGRRGGKPRLGGEGVARGLGAARAGLAVRGAVEGRRGVGRAGDRAGGAVGHATAEHEVVTAGPVDRLGLTSSLVQPPVVGGAVVGHRLGVRTVVDHRGAGGDGARAALHGVAARVGRCDVVAVGLAAGQAGVGEDLRRPAPEVGGGRLGEDRCGRPAAVELVGQRGVVTVDVGEPGDADRGAGDAAQGRRALDGLAGRAHLVGGDRGHREADEALLGGAVDRRELPALHDVLAGGLGGPATLALPGVGAGRHVGVPVDDRGGRLALEVGVAAGVVRAGRGGRVEGEGVRALPAVPRVGVGEAVHVGAVVVVADGVDDSVGRGHVVGVAVAVGHGLDRPRRRVGLEHALEVAGTAEPVAGAVDVRVVGAQAVDGGRGSVVLDGLVGGEGVERAGRRVERAQARGEGAVHVGEGTADDQPGLVRGQRHRLHGAVGGRCPRQGRPVGGADRGEPGAADAVHGGEEATEVDRGAADRDREDVGAGGRGEGGDERAVGGVEGRHAAAAEAVHLGERADDVEPRLVRRDRHRADAAVHVGREARVQDARTQVVGQQVVAGNGVHAGRRARGTSGGELAAGVDGVTDDRLVPGDAVDLRGGQGVGGHPRGGVAVDHVVRGVRGCGGGRRIGQDDQPGGQHSGGQQAGEAASDEQRRKRHEVIPERE